MTSRIERLDWDSDFFGVPIGRIDLDEVEEPVLVEIDEEARDLGLACLFGRLTPQIGDASVLVQEHGHRLVEVGIRFDRQPGPLELPPTKSRLRQGEPSDVAAASELLEPLAPWSRFAVDERFGLDSARRLQEAWFLRAAREPDERLFTITEDESGITGVMTGARRPVPGMDLLVVSSGGSGAADHLLNSLIECAAGGVVEAGAAAARNIAILRYLGRCGFRACETEYVYHRWLDDTSRARP